MRDSRAPLDLLPSPHVCLRRQEKAARVTIGKDRCLPARPASGRDDTDRAEAASAAERGEVDLDRNLLLDRQEEPSSAGGARLSPPDRPAHLERHPLIKLARSGMLFPRATRLFDARRTAGAGTARQQSTYLSKSDQRRHACIIADQPVTG